MPSRKPRYVISLQSTQGTSPKLSFEVTGHKAEKIIHLIRSDVEKHKKKTETTSVTLDQFFND